MTSKLPSRSYTVAQLAIGTLSARSENVRYDGATVRVRWSSAGGEGPRVRREVILGPSHCTSHLRTFVPSHRTRSTSAPTRNALEPLTGIRAAAARVRLAGGIDRHHVAIHRMPIRIGIDARDGERLRQPRNHIGPSR